MRSEWGRFVFLERTDLSSWRATAVKSRVAVASISQVKIENLLEIQEGKQHPDLPEVTFLENSVSVS